MGDCTAILGLQKPHSGTNVVDGTDTESKNLDLIDAAIGALQRGGTGSDAYFAFVQTVASSSWHIQHNLGKFPSVTVVDSSGHQVFGDVQQNSQNDLTVFFSAPFAGDAYLN